MQTVWLRQNYHQFHVLAIWHNSYFILAIMILIIVANSVHYSLHLSFAGVIVTEVAGNSLTPMAHTHTDNWMTQNNVIKLTFCCKIWLYSLDVTWDEWWMWLGMNDECDPKWRLNVPGISDRLLGYYHHYYQDIKFCKQQLRSIFSIINAGNIRFSSIDTVFDLRC